MHAPLGPSSKPPNRGHLLSLSVGPVYEREGGRDVRAGVLAIADGLVAPRPFWELLQGLAVRAEPDPLSPWSEIASETPPAKVA